MAVTEKTCTACHQVKSMDDFHIKKVIKGEVRFRSQCKICFNRINLEGKKKNPNYKKRKREFELKRKYGLDLETYENMKSNQNNLCAICNSPQRGKELHVDHCHSSGKVRQLLCSRCNLVLGQAGDNISLLEGCILYLTTHNNPT